MKKNDWYLLGGVAILAYLIYNSSKSIKGLYGYQDVDSLTKKIFGKTFKKTKSINNSSHE